MMKMTDADIKAWADRLRDRYGIPYAVDMLTHSEDWAAALTATAYVEGGVPIGHLINRR